MEEKNLSNNIQNNQGNEKVITIKIKDINQLKIILATWYSYLLTKNKNDKKQIDFQEAIKTPIIYNIEKDELELLLTGTQEMLEELNQYVQNLNQELKKKK